MEITGKSKLEKLSRKNRGNTLLIQAIDQLVDDLLFKFLVLNSPVILFINVLSQLNDEFHFLILKFQYVIFKKKIFNFQRLRSKNLFIKKNFQILLFLFL